MPGFQKMAFTGLRRASIPERMDSRRTRPRRQRGRVGAYLALTKPRVMELLLLTTAPTMILAQGGLPNPVLVVATLVGGAASAGSAAVFNMYIDRDIDVLMTRTSSRPIVTGEISPRNALRFAWLLAAFSTVWFAVIVNPLAATLSVCAIFWYVVVYTMILKRRTTQNIVWGGLAGCFPVPIAWASVTGTLAWPSVALFFVVFFWTPAHYWPLSVRYRDDYRRAGIPMLGAIRAPSRVATAVLGYAFSTVLCSLSLIPLAQMGPVYAVISVLAGGWFLWHALRFVQRARSQPPTDARPMRVFLASNVYLAVLFVAVAVDTAIFQ